MEDLRGLWRAWQTGENALYDLGSLSEYGLSFGFVSPGSYSGQRERYFRYQLSWGGPSDEFRFFINPDLSCHRIEYWFLDWFDGANRCLAGRDESILLELWDWFCECGMADAELADGRP